MENNTGTYYCNSYPMPVGTPTGGIVTVTDQRSPTSSMVVTNGYSKCFSFEIVLLSSSFSHYFYF